MEVKNTDERTELINPSKSKNKRSDNMLKGQNEKDFMKTDVINLDKPMNSNSNTGNTANNNLFNNNDNLIGGNKYSDPNNKQNGYDAKNDKDASKNNFKGKQEDISIVDITKGGRIITDLEIKNAPVLLLEVICYFRAKFVFLI